MRVLCGSELAPTGAVLAWSLALWRYGAAGSRNRAITGK